jgi:predicted RNase H-like HicB family nuclease
MREYTVILHPDETGGYWTEVPALPGCGSQGETVEEALEMTKDAIGLWLEELRSLR